MSSGMNVKEAEKIADKMSYRQAIMNCLNARCVPYRKATKIKMKRLLESIDNDKPLWKSDEHFINACNESYQQGAKEFANWLPNHFDLRFSNNPDVWLDEFFNHTLENFLAKGRKENKNE